MTESCSSHNIDEQVIIGMFSSSKQRAKHAAMCFLSYRMLAKKNHVVEYINMMPPTKRNEVITWAIGAAMNKRRLNREKSQTAARTLKEGSTETKKKTREVRKENNLTANSRHLS